MNRQPWAHAVRLGAALAVAAGAAPAATLEEVVVTARKVEETLQNIPVSVTAFGSDFLQQKGLQDIGDVGNYTPNLHFSNGPSGSGSGANFYVRGIGQTDWIPTQDPGVGTYLDGVYLGRMTGSLLRLADVERVEVLRGPQGTLFGKNTIGGAVQLVTKQPGPEREGSAEITAGRFGRLDGKFVYNMPLSEDLYARVAGLYLSNDGFAKRLVDGQDAGDDQDVAGRIEMLWNARENLSVQVSADATRRRAHPNAQTLVTGSTVPVAIPDEPREKIAAGVEPWEDDLDVFGISGTVDWDLGAVQIKSVTAYRDMELDFTSDFDGSPVHSNEINFSSNQDQFSQELQVSGTLLDERLDWLVGFYYFEENLDFVNVTINGPGPDDVGTIDDVVQETTNISGFGHVTWRVTDTLGITAGLRYTDEEKDAVLTAPLVLGGRDVSQSFDDLNPKVSVDYRFNDNFMVYASWSQGFKSGGVNGRIVPESLNTDTFDAEEVTAYEVGFKSDWLDNRLRLNAAGFFSDYTDFQTVTLILDTNGVPFFPVANAGDVDVFGFEIEAEALLFDSIRVIANAGYTDESIASVNPVAFALTFNEDTELPGAPSWNTMLALQYTHPVNWGSLLAGSFIIDADWSYKTEHTFLSIDDPFATQDGYSVVNTRLTFVHDSDDWEVAIWGKNVTDEEYAVFRQNLGGPPFPPNQTFNLAHFGRPLEWGVTLRFKF